MKKILTLFLIFTMLFSSLALVSCNDENQNEKQEERTSYTFAVLSDIHLQIEDKTTEENFARAIAVCKAQAESQGKTLSAIVIAGDLIDNTWYQTLTYEDEVFTNDATHRDAQLAYLQETFDKYIPEDVALFYCLGNHDMVRNAKTYKLSTGSTTESSRGISSQKYYEALKKSTHNYFQYDEQTDHTSIGYTYEGMCKDGLRYVRQNGNNFVMIDNDYYWKESGTYDQERLQWLEETLAYIDTTYPSEPIFLITHNPTYGSVLHTDDTDASSDLIDVVKNYPQTIVISGHIHKSNDTEYAICSDTGFICVEASTTKATNSTTYCDSNHKPTDDRLTYYTTSYVNNTAGCSEGLLFTVNTDTSVTIERMNFLTGEKSGNDWIISPVGSTNRVSDYQTSNRILQNTSPYFDENATFKAEIVGDYLNVKFSPAKDDNDTVWAYRIFAYDSSNSQIGKEVVLAPARNIAEEPEYYYVSFASQAQIAYVEIVPEDSFYSFGKGKKITYEAFTNETTTQPNSYVGSTTNITGAVTIDGYTLCESLQYRHLENNVLTNLNSAYARGNSYFNAYGTKYSYSFRISNSRCNRSATANGHTECDYRLGTCLASYVYNGRQFSICAGIDFNTPDDANNPNATSELRSTLNEVYYYLTIGAPSMSTEATIVKLKSDKIDDTKMSAIKTAFESENGAVLSVVREGTTFTISIDGEVLSTYQANDMFYSNAYAPFSAETVATFGVACYGGEANFSDFTLTECK